MDARVADAPSPADDRGEAVGLKAYLSGLAARLREVPPAWVRCELLALQPGPRFVRVELIEHDEGGGKLAQASGGCWPGVHRRVEQGFAALADDPDRARAARRLTVRVGDGQTVAQHRIPDEHAVVELLQTLLAARREAGPAR